jgi:hypothetical protein
MLKKLLAFTCLTLSIGVNAATIVNVGGQAYSIDTILGTFSNNEALLTSQPWTGSIGGARDFAEAVGDAFGYPNSGGLYSPWFVVSASSPAAVGGDGQVNAFTFQSSSLDSGIHVTGYSNVNTYAVATSVVPIPAAAWLFGSALLGLVGVSRRRKA